MTLFIDLDGVLGEIRYRDKIRLEWEEWDTCKDICSWKKKEPTILVDYLNKLLKNVKCNIYILTNLPGTKINHIHAKCKKEWCKKYLKFKYTDVIVNNEGYSKWRKALDITHNSKNNILLDDCVPNLIDWEANGGIGIHVSSLLTKNGRKGFERKIK